MRILSISICVLTIALSVSCSFFRKKSNLTNVVQLRDSVGVLDSLTAAYHFDFVNNENKKYSLSAKGFQRILIDANGNIYAEGENGQLDLLQNEDKNNNSSGEGKRKEVHTASTVKDSSNLVIDNKYEYKAKPDAWTVSWLGIVITVLALAIFYFLFKSFL